MKKFIGFIPLILLVVPVIAQDSTVSPGRAGVADVAEEDPGLFMVMMMILLVLMAALVLTAIFAAMFWMLMLALAFAGIVSVSVFMGWYQKSVSAGLIWFVLLCFGFVGMSSGLLIYLFVVGVSDWEYSTANMLLYAAPAGLLGGLLTGWIFVMVMKRLLGFVRKKLDFRTVK